MYCQGQEIKTRSGFTDTAVFYITDQRQYDLVMKGMTFIIVISPLSR